MDWNLLILRLPPTILVLIPVWKWLTQPKSVLGNWLYSQKELSLDEEGNEISFNTPLDPSVENLNKIWAFAKKGHIYIYNFLQTVVIKDNFFYEGSGSYTVQQLIFPVIIFSIFVYVGVYFYYGRPPGRIPAILTHDYWFPPPPPPPLLLKDRILTLDEKEELGFAYNNTGNEVAYPSDEDLPMFDANSKVQVEVPQTDLKPTDSKVKYQKHLLESVPEDASGAAGTGL